MDQTSVGEENASVLGAELAEAAVVGWWEEEPMQEVPPAAFVAVAASQPELPAGHSSRLPRQVSAVLAVAVQGPVVAYEPNLLAVKVRVAELAPVVGAADDGGWG